MYYRHQVHGTRPNPKRGKHAVVEVTDLEGGETFKIETEHAVLNIPTEVSPATDLVYCFGACVCYRLQREEQGGGGGGGHGLRVRFSRCRTDLCRIMKEALR